MFHAASVSASGLGGVILAIDRLLGFLSRPIRVRCRKPASDVGTKQLTTILPQPLVFTLGKVVVPKGNLLTEASVDLEPECPDDIHTQRGKGVALVRLPSLFTTGLKGKGTVHVRELQVVALRKIMVTVIINPRTRVLERRDGEVRHSP